MTQTIDEQIKKLEATVQKLRVSVEETKEKIEKNWKTKTVVFKVNGVNINLRVLKKNETVAAMALILSQKEFFEKSAKLLNTKEEFTIGSDSFEDIVFDFQKHIAALEIKEKEERLSMAEAKLNSIMSEDARRERILQQVAEDLSQFEE